MSSSSGRSKIECSISHHAKINGDDYCIKNKYHLSNNEIVVLEKDHVHIATSPVNFDNNLKSVVNNIRGVRGLKIENDVGSVFPPVLREEIYEKLNNEVTVDSVYLASKYEIHAIEKRTGEPNVSNSYSIENTSDFEDGDVQFYIYLNDPNDIKHSFINLQKFATEIQLILFKYTFQDLGRLTKDVINFGVDLKSIYFMKKNISNLIEVQQNTRNKNEWEKNFANMEGIRENLNFLLNLRQEIYLGLRQAYDIINYYSDEN